MKNRSRHANYNIAYFLSDILLASLAFVITSLIFKCKYIANLDYYILHASAIFLIIVFNNSKRLYDTTLFFYFDRWLNYLSWDFIYSNGLVIVLAFWVGRCKVSIFFYLMFCIIEYIFLLLSAFGMRKILRKRKTYASRTLLVGSKEMYEKVLRFIGHNSMSVDVIGYLAETDDIPENDNTPYL